MSRKNSARYGAHHPARGTARPVEFAAGGIVRRRSSVSRRTPFPPCSSRQIPRTAWHRRDNPPLLARSQLIASQRHHVVRLVRRNPLKRGLNRFGQGFQPEWFLKQGMIAQVAPESRQIRITTGEQHLEIGPG